MQKTGKLVVTVSKPRSLRSDQEFLPAALQILETPQSPVTSAFTLVICTLVVVALTWSYFGKIDIVAVAPGKFAALGRTKVIEPLETGKVRAISAMNGSEVKAGDILVELDGTEASSEEAALAADLMSFQAEAIRRTVELEAATQETISLPSIDWPADVPASFRRREERVLAADLRHVEADTSSLKAQLDQKTIEAARLSDTIAAETDLIATLQDRVNMKTELVSVNAGTKASLLDAAETLKYQITTLATQRGQLAQAMAGRSVLEREIVKTREAFLSETSQKLADDERQVDNLEQKLNKARSVTQHMVIRSPVDGVVQASSLTNPGQVFTTGTEMMRVVPKGTRLEIEAYLPNEDIGFVRAGQHAVVKVASFPFTRYGTLSATVSRVATDAVPDPEAQQSQGSPARPTPTSMFAGAQRTQELVFPVTLVADRTSIQADGIDVPLSPGMSVSVEIQTGKRRILEYLFSPLVETASQALKER